MSGFSWCRLLFFITGFLFLGLRGAVGQDAVMGVQAEDWCLNPPAGQSKGGFEVLVGGVPTTVVCGLNVPITVRNTTANPSSLFTYLYNYRGGNPLTDPTLITSATTYTYKDAGEYTILQLGSVGGTGSIACQKIVVYDTSPISVSTSVCSDNTVRVEITNNAASALYDAFVIDWDDGSPVERIPKTQLTASRKYVSGSRPIIKVSGVYLDKSSPSRVVCQGTVVSAIVPITPSSEPLITRLLTRKDNTARLNVSNLARGQVVRIEQLASNGTVASVQSFTATDASDIFDFTGPVSSSSCFRAVVTDACSQVVRSNEVCGITLDVTPVDLANKLDWNTNWKDVQTFSVFLNGSTPLETSLAGLTTTYTHDKNIFCGDIYSYQVFGFGNKGLTTIVSDIVSVTGISTKVPPAFASVMVSVTPDENVNLIATFGSGAPPPVSFRMIVFRQDSPGGPFSKLAEVLSNTYNDTKADVNAQSYCYKVAYQNECGNTSPISDPACTVWLKSNSPTTIDWTPDSPFAGSGVELYTLEKLDERGSIISEDPLMPNTPFRPDISDPSIQLFKFRVVARSADGTFSYSNFRRFKSISKLYLPDAFTPNADGANDYLTIQGSPFLTDIKMVIFNRWGEPIFSTNSRDGWDGTVNGQRAPEGTYLYRIEAKDQMGDLVVQRGAVLLLR